MPFQSDPSGVSLGQTAGGTRQFAITPDDNTDLAVVVRALRIGDVSGGDSVRFLAYGDTAPVTWVNVAEGEIIPMYVKRVYSTGTTATSILGLY